MAYILRLGDRTYSRRFHTNSVYLNVDFTRSWTHVLPADVPEQLHDTFSNILIDIGNYLNCEPEDQVRLNISHPGLHTPAWIPFQKWPDVKAVDILNKIATILQSNEQFRLDERLRMHVCHVRVPKGDGQGRFGARESVSIEEYLKRKKSIVRIKNTDRLCFQRAIVVAKHYAAKNDSPEWERERKRITLRSGPYSWQTKCAQQFIAECNVPATACQGKETWELYQKTLRQQGYQLFIYSQLVFGKLVYKGNVSGTPKKLHLYHHDHHYDVIVSMPGFLERSYYCELCDKGYSDKATHPCTSVCSACRRPGADCPTDSPRSCYECYRTFHCEACFKAHQITRGRPNTATVCNRWKRCTLCGKEWNTSKKCRRLDEHICGEYQCRVCSLWHTKSDKWCYIQPYHVDKTQTEQKQEKDVTRFVFYDFECHQNTGEHIPNLCVLQLCCHFCIGSTEPCHHCDSSWNHRKEVIMSGANTLDDVSKFFVHLAAKKIVPGGSLSTKSQHIVAVAHNFRGYDGMIVLQGLHKHAMVPPKVILNGGKVLTIELGSVRFIDSLSFLSMPLRDLPKTFGITELQKGYFPHFFNRTENTRYIGPYPAVEYYDPDGMSVGERDKFYDWYQQQQTKTFHFEQELVSYCRSDVDILRRCCGAFRSIFLTETGIDPFLDSLTLASACNKIFRAHYMEPQTLVIIPRALMQSSNTDWKKLQPRQQSNKALRWLEWRQHQYTIQALSHQQPTPNIKHARNGGEIKAGPYSLDGYDPTTNRAFEFYGCCYHGCGICYPGPFEDLKHYHPFDPSRTMRDLNRHTMDRLEKLKTLGIDNIETIWECEFERQRQKDPEMDEFLNGLESRGWPCPDSLSPRDAFFGGRTNAIQLMAEPRDELEEIHYVDVVSLYPYVCKYGKFPIHHPDIITQPELSRWHEYEGLIKCRVIPPKSLYHPVLPFRNSKLTFPLCRSCVQDKMKPEDFTLYESCHHTDEDRSWVGTFVSVELKKAVEMGYRISDIYEVWHWNQWSQYDPVTRTGGLFTGYINRYLKMKMESSGYPENCRTKEEKAQFVNEVYQKEGILLDADNIVPNKGIRSFSKAILVTLWGKFGQRDNFSQTEYVTDPSQFFQMMNSTSEIIKDVQVVNENMVVIEKLKKEEHVQPCPITNVVIAAFVTAQARLKLYSVLEPLGDRACYFDTDSIIYRHHPLKWNPDEGSSLGEWKSELPENVYIKHFVSGGPKNYAYRLSNDETVCKVRGFSLNYRGSQQLNFETIKNMVNHLGEKKVVSVHNPHKIVRSRDRILQTHSEEKDYKVVYTKRMIILNENGEPTNTLPYGFVE